MQHAVSSSFLFRAFASANVVFSARASRVIFKACHELADWKKGHLAPAFNECVSLLVRSGGMLTLHMQWILKWKIVNRFQWQWPQWIGLADPLNLLPELVSLQKVVGGLPEKNKTFSCTATSLGKFPCKYSYTFVDSKNMFFLHCNSNAKCK